MIYWDRFICLGISYSMSITAQCEKHKPQGNTVFSCWNIMMTSSNGNIFRVTGHLWGNSPVSGEFLAQRPVTRSFDIVFELRLNKRLSKQSRGLRRYRAHYDVSVMCTAYIALILKKEMYINVGWCIYVINWINSLTPGKFEYSYGTVISKVILVIDNWGISDGLRWMSLALLIIRQH